MSLTDADSALLAEAKKLCKSENGYDILRRCLPIIEQLVALVEKLQEGGDAKSR